MAVRVGRGLRKPPAPRTGPRRALAHRAADRLLAGRGDLRGTGYGDRGDMTTTTQEEQAVERVPKQLYLGGEWRDAAGGATLAVEDPATGEALCEVADATPDDAVAALGAAADAQADWARTPPRERGEILRRAFEAI